jgi:hypothetical protein
VSWIALGGSVAGPIPPVYRRLLGRAPGAITPLHRVGLQALQAELMQYAEVAGAFEWHRSGATDPELCGTVTIPARSARGQRARVISRGVGSISRGTYSRSAGCRGLSLVSTYVCSEARPQPNVRE